MSKAKINKETRLKLAIKSGGRCQRCGTYLFEDFLTKTPVEFAEHAHIIPDSDFGPRYKEGKIIKYKEGVENLMLLCSSCHTIIDKKPDEFPVTLLLDLKKQHEDRIYLMTESVKFNKAKNIFFSSKIGDKPYIINQDEMNRALVNNGFYPEGIPYNLSNESTLYDNSDLYYKEKTRELETSFKDLKNILDRNNISTLSLYAMAPQPLLIKLGTIFNSGYDVIINQRNKDTKSWLWPDTHEDVSFSIKKPKSINRSNTVCILLELSDKVDESRISEVITENYDLWKITTPNPNLNLVQSKEDILNFSKKAKELFSEILLKYGKEKEILIFPVMPLSLAIEFGRVHMPKVNNTMIIYDQIKTDGNNKFIKRLKI